MLPRWPLRFFLAEKLRQHCRHPLLILKWVNWMVNDDLPWNPNQLEQRFGRIRRIGQAEICHLWSVVARETREGDVYHRPLEKMETENELKLLLRKATNQ